MAINSIRADKLSTIVPRILNIDYVLIASVIFLTSIFPHTTWDNQIFLLLDTTLLLMGSTLCVM